MSKITVNQLETTLRTLTKNERFSKCKSFDCLLDVLMTECESFRAPFYIHDVSVAEERIMLYNHKLYNPKSKLLIEQLASRYKEVLMMVDAVLPAKEAVHFVTMTDDSKTIREWVSMLTRYDLMLRQINDDQYILVAPITSFLKRHAD
jgi:hypothetical protein